MPKFLGGKLWKVFPFPPHPSFIPIYRNPQRIKGYCLFHLQAGNQDHLVQGHIHPVMVMVLVMVVIGLMEAGSKRSQTKQYIRIARVFLSYAPRIENEHIEQYETDQSHYGHR